MTDIDGLRQHAQASPPSPPRTAAGYRTDRGWTQEQLASEAGVGHGTVGRVEQGRDTTTVVLRKISKALGVPFMEYVAAYYVVRAARGE